MFLVTSSFALTLNKFSVSKRAVSAAFSSPQTAKRESLLIEYPILGDNDSFPLFSAQAILAKDLKTGAVLYEKNSDFPLLPASTTKIITALVVLDHYPMNQVLEVIDVNVDGQKMGLVVGEQITTESLLYGLLVFSANDAAEVVAQNYPGGREAFVAAMNTKASELKLADTVFSNPSGLDGVRHITTAQDLTSASVAAMENPLFAKMVGVKEKQVASTDGKIVHNLVNINELVGSVDGVKGVKTGWTENALENLVTYIERDEREIMITLLGSQDRFGETKELIDWIFENFDWVQIPKSTLIINN